MKKQWRVIIIPWYTAAEILKLLASLLKDSHCREK
jgi:hypothetical protein